MPRIVAAVGLVLALAALMDTRAALDALPAMRVTFTVPQGLLVASGIVLLLAWAFMMVAARSRRKPDEEPESDTRRHWPWWRQVLAQLVLLAPIVATVLVLWLDGGRLAAAVLALGQAFFGGSGLAPDGAADGPVISLPWVGWSVGLLALAAALLTLAVALLIVFSDRLVAWWLARHRRGDAADMAQVVDESLGDLDADADPRAAIIRCYRRFEQVAARARVRREPWQTADEFLRDLLRRLDVPDVAVTRLTRLFEMARFSEHPLGPTERELARACLAEIRVTLERPEPAVAIA